MLKEKIKDADIILIGIGEEFEEPNLYKEDETYRKGIALFEENKCEWLIPAWREYIVCKNGSRIVQTLSSLLDLIKDKNYFVISLCIDSRIKNLSWKDQRIVMPCGDNTKIQCKSGCENEIKNISEEQSEYIKALFQKIAENQDNLESRIREMNGLEHCKSCDNQYVLNNIYLEHYNEGGYLEQWNKYLKWLQSTVNRKLLVLELGVGMKFPSVIRWPFEKTVFFNNKAELIRVNESLYQMTEELADKGTGIHKNAIEWLNNL